MKLLITIGDCNGIGIEIMLKSLTQFIDGINNKEVEVSIIGRLNVIKAYSELINFPLIVTDDSIIISNRECKVIECSTDSKIDFGEVTENAGKLAAEAIEKGVDLTKSGEFDALVTMPVSKFSLYRAGWKYPGHTEMLAERCSDGNYLMILHKDKMRAALTTIHIPVKEVSETINTELIISKAKILSNSLKIDFGIKEPVIAVLGLNPHAGEDGSIGTEEENIIAPAINRLTSMGVKAAGPFPADGFFAHEEYKNYDGILAMYHDQGLIPLKLLANGGGVNFTAGLDIVRTSPDHGTAFAIAGRNIANPQSALDALNFAVDVVNRRKI